MVTLALSEGEGDPAWRLLVSGLAVVWRLRRAVHRTPGSSHGKDPQYEALPAAQTTENLHAPRLIYLPQEAQVWLMSQVGVGPSITRPTGCPPWPGPTRPSELSACSSRPSAMPSLSRFKADPPKRRVRGA